MRTRKQINAYHRKWYRKHKRTVKRINQRWRKRHYKQFTHVNRKGLASWYIRNLNNKTELLHFQRIINKRLKQIQKGE